MEREGTCSEDEITIAILPKSKVNPPIFTSSDTLFSLAGAAHKGHVGQGEVTHGGHGDSAYLGSVDNDMPVFATVLAYLVTTYRA